MSVNYGITAINSDGDIITSPATLAALYAGTVTCSITSGTQVFDFPNVPGGALYALQLGAGAHFGGGTHTWVISTVSGHARITFTYNKLPYQASANTTLRLFATDTFEPDYGINALNDFGERTISTIYPMSRFVGKITIPSTAYSYGLPNDLDTIRLRSTATASADSIVFWSLPSSTDTTIWWQGDTHVSSGSTVSINAVLPSGTVPSVRPEAFLFATGPLVVTSTWGLRVFNGAGQVMFDAGTESLKIEARLTSVAYDLVGDSYTLPSGFTPAFYQPAYVNQSKTGGCVDGLAGMREYGGCMRRNGTTLYTKAVALGIDPEGWDCREATDDYYFGLNTNLFVPVINANRYGGLSI